MSSFFPSRFKKGLTTLEALFSLILHEFLKAKRPKCFLLENVKNLRSHDKGKTFDIIMNTLLELDYDVSSSILRARDFGCPQNRERIYIVGFDKQQIKMPKFFIP